MKIIQFQCNIPQIAEGLKSIMLVQVNIWSRLHRLNNDANYVTEEFGADTWKTHTQFTDLFWADWDSIYSNLGDDGRAIADQFFGDGSMQGILLATDLMPTTAPGVRLQIINSADPVADGYLLPTIIVEE